MIIIFTERCNFIAGEEFEVYVMYGRLGRALFRKACVYQAFLQKKTDAWGLVLFICYMCIKQKRLNERNSSYHSVFIVDLYNLL